MVDYDGISGFICSDLWQYAAALGLLFAQQHVLSQYEFTVLSKHIYLDFA